VNKLTKVIIFTLITSSVIAVENKKEDSIVFDKNTSIAFDRTPKINNQKNGQISLDTSNSFKNVILTRINKDGKLETYCTDNKLKAKQFLNGVSLINIEGGTQ